MKYRKGLTVGLFLITAVLFLSWFSNGLRAHGTDIEYDIVTAINVTALFEDGTPMGACQYIVYAPDNPAEAWANGDCDENGRFTINPDTTITGNWAVNIREAGHGDIINIPINDEGVAFAAQPQSNTLQSILTGLAVVWGFVGTALYFSNRQPKASDT